MRTDWRPIGTVPAHSLTPARLQLHYAAYVLGSTAHSVLEHRDDDSHSNLGFDADLDSLHTWPLTDAGVDGACTLHLDLPGFALVLRVGDEPRARLSLGGQSVDDALAWVAGELANRVPDAVTLARRSYPDFPPSPLEDGATFEPPPTADLTELAAWFANAHGLFDELGAEHPDMSPPRVWPHHFDLGTLLPLPGGADRTIGLGLSPGDRTYDQPYFYASPYPSPGADAGLPILVHGHWHTDGFVSAVLTADALRAAGSQSEAARAYLAEAVAACRAVIG